MMQRRFFWVVLMMFMGLALASPLALAAEPAVKGEAQAAIESVGKAYQAVADKFGCTVFAGGGLAPDGNVMSLEFIPAGDKVESWTRLFSVTVFALPTEAKASADAMTQLMNGLLSNAKEKGKVINSTFFRNVQGESGAFLEYEIGEGLLKEHNVGIFMRTSDKTAAFMQVQVRGNRAFDPKDAAGILGLVEAPKAEIPSDQPVSGGK